MIPDYRLYHGAVLASLLGSMNVGVRVSAEPHAGRLLNYILNERVGLQVKYATQRLHPWHFSFQESHVRALESLAARLPACFLVLVCERDGFIALDADQVLSAFLPLSTGQSWLRADRKKREMYRVYGPAGELPGRFRTTLDPVLEAILDDSPQGNESIRQPHNV